MSVYVCRRQSGHGIGINSSADFTVGKWVDTALLYIAPFGLDEPVFVFIPSIELNGQFFIGASLLILRDGSGPAPRICDPGSQNEFC